MSRSFSFLLWAMVAVYAAVIVLQPLGLLPGGLNAPLSALLPMAFALLHGSKQYSWRDMLVFSAICLVVSNALENLSIVTGFPFGHYHYGDALGPKLFLVPLLIGPAYLGMGYLSWTLARLILGTRRARADGLFAVPAIAGFVMVSWDLTFDPIASTIGHSWIWHDGGAYFGVPVSNFLGWYLTVYVIFQLFALYLHRRRGDLRQQSVANLWRPAVAMYAVTALRPVLTFLSHSAEQATVSDQAGVAWQVGALYGTCALAAIFTMGAFTVLALLRLAERGR
ncbi:MAG: hypothetical protein QOH47_286 [Sphingomonadales bacterium]|nr:hypothetical protein [Sphingomonadales bacterium]